MSNVVVITFEPMDFGWGEDTRIEFVDCKYHAEKPEEGGRLHVQSVNPEIQGNIATFQKDEWRCVLRGNLVEHPHYNGRAVPATQESPRAMVTQGAGQ